MCGPVPLDELVFDDPVDLPCDGVKVLCIDRVECPFPDLQAGAPVACASPPPSAWTTTSGASMPSSASTSPPSEVSKNMRASSSPSARRAGSGVLWRVLPFGGDALPGAAKFSRQFTSVLPVILATSG